MELKKECKGCGTFRGCFIHDTEYQSKCPCIDCVVKSMCKHVCNERNKVGVDYLMSVLDEDGSKHKRLKSIANGLK